MALVVRAPSRRLTSRSLPSGPPGFDADRRSVHRYSPGPGTEGTPGDLMERLRDGLEQNGHPGSGTCCLLDRPSWAQGLSRWHLRGLGAVWSLLKHGRPAPLLRNRPGQAHRPAWCSPARRTQATRHCSSGISRRRSSAADCFRAVRPPRHQGQRLVALYQGPDRRRRLRRTSRAGPHRAPGRRRRRSLGARGPGRASRSSLDEFAQDRDWRWGRIALASTEVYELAVPATEQFGVQRRDRIQTTSPWDRQGQSWVTYQRACAIDVETDGPFEPTLLMVQLPSWALYQDHEQAEEIEMPPGGRASPAGCRPSSSTTIASGRRRRPTLTRSPLSTMPSGVRAGTSACRLGSATGSSPTSTAPLSSPSRRRPLGTVYVAHGGPWRSQANIAFYHRPPRGGRTGHVEDAVARLLHHGRRAGTPRVSSTTSRSRRRSSTCASDSGSRHEFGPWTRPLDPAPAASINQANVPRRTQVTDRSPYRGAELRVAEIFKTAIDHDLTTPPHYPLADAEPRGRGTRRGRSGRRLPDPRDQGRCRRDDVGHLHPDRGTSDRDLRPARLTSDPGRRTGALVAPAGGGQARSHRVAPRPHLGEIAPVPQRPRASTTTQLAA